MQEKTTKLGIIGLGHMGGYHLGACSLIPTIEIVGVADPNSSNLEKINSTKIKKSSSFLDWIDLVEGVIIAAPTMFHYELAKACLERKKHVLLEKPITKDINQAKELFEIAAKNNLTLHSGHVERFNGAIQELKKLVYNPYLIESQRIGPFTPRASNETVVLDLMIHDLDIISSIAKSPVKKFDVIAKKIVSKFCDIASVQIEFESGLLANIISSRVSHIKRRTMAVHQKDEFLQLDFTTQDISIHRHTTTSVTTGHNQLRYQQAGTIERLFVYKENPLKLELEHFVSSIRTGKNQIDPEHDIDALKLALDIEHAVNV